MSTGNSPTTENSGNGVLEVTDSMANMALREDKSSAMDICSNKKKSESTPRPLVIYTRTQLLLLHKSPLVCVPDNMPALKDWFGSENEQIVNKKEIESTNAPAIRDRRFRREVEEAGETTQRASFRSSLTQPSQMGNFKHQSLRSTDRERDRDVDRERERDMRDKEGQERLRNLSDKYDRDRLALTPTLSGVRSKERDSAPHLSSSSSNKLGVSTQTTSSATRRTDPRETTKKKPGESSEDWRRGAEPPRPGRDHDDRERPHSRVRDASRSRRDPSTSRRDRDRDDKEKDTERERDRLHDDYRREREAYRRDRDDRSRREKDPDREIDSDDLRRWRDDGKRDERIAARREREYRERLRDRASRDPGSDTPSDRFQDRRWTVVEERDGRARRPTGRDRRTALPEEGRDKEDRRDREKEREPAWMDTYIPTSSSNGGILGGKSADGELDGIQAWKKGLKENQPTVKDNPSEVAEHASGQPAVPTTIEPLSAARPEPEKQLDEIQQFKLMMKREEEKKRQTTTSQKTDIPDPSSRIPHANESDSIDLKVISSASPLEHTLYSSNQDSNAIQNIQEEPTRPPGLGSRASFSPSSSSSAQGPAPDDPLSLLSLLSNDPNPTAATTLGGGQFDLPSDRRGSRFFPNPLTSNTPTPTQQISEHTPVDRVSLSPPVPNQFNPPPGSRLLALGNRGPSLTGSQLPKSQSSTNSSPSLPQIQQPGSHSTAFANVGLSQSADGLLNNRSVSESTRSPQNIHHYEDASRSSFGFEESLDAGHFTSPDTLRRLPDSGTYNDVNNLGKGSRFAKFFDGRAKDGPPGIQKGPSFASSSPIPMQRQEASGFNGIPGTGTDNRTMDDIFAMLNSSTQNTRNAPPLPSQTSSNAFGQGPGLQPQLLANPRIDSLYDSRIDDRNFVPDGLVPGLRSVPPRSRENSSIYSDAMDDVLQYNAQRVNAPRGTIDQMYSGPISSMYAPHQGGRSVSLPIQQPPYRGGPSPITGQNPLQGLGQQRLPPGLANLGGRPPHEPSQFIGTPMGMNPGGMHGLLHIGGPSQQFNNFGPGGGLGYGPQVRGVPPPVPHPLQSSLGHNPLGSLGHPSNIDLRGSNSGPLLGLSGNVGIGGGVRGGGVFGGPQQGPGPQMQGPHVGMRQQQQLPPHMMPHMLPPHLQQQGPPGGVNQPAHDLMALLMGGPHRE